MKENVLSLSVSLGSRIGRERLVKLAQTIQVKRGPQPTKPTIWDLFSKAEDAEMARARVSTRYTGPIIRRKKPIEDGTFNVLFNRKGRVT